VAPRIGVVVFPGSNCEHDVIQGVEAVGAEGVLLWHGDTRLGGVDAVVADVRAFEAGADPSDDLTILALRLRDGA